MDKTGTQEIRNGVGICILNSKENRINGLAIIEAIGNVKAEKDRKARKGGKEIKAVKALNVKIKVQNVLVKNVSDNVKRVTLILNRIWYNVVEIERRAEIVAGRADFLLFVNVVVFIRHV